MISLMTWDMSLTHALRGELGGERGGELRGELQKRKRLFPILLVEFKMSTDNSNKNSSVEHSYQ